jgi:hypothetical protein
MPEIIELLERLKSLDLAAYSEILRLELVGYHQPRNQALDHLQGCVQRAITEKKWRSEVIINPRILDEKIIYLGFVTPRKQVKCYPHLGLGTKEPIEGDGSRMEWRDGCKTGAYGDNQAHALLHAYVICLETKP